MRYCYDREKIFAAFSTKFIQDIKHLSRTFARCRGLYENTRQRRKKVPRRLSGRSNRVSPGASRGDGETLYFVRKNLASSKEISGTAREEAAGFTASAKLTRTYRTTAINFYPVCFMIMESPVQRSNCLYTSKRLLRISQLRR